MKTQTAITPVTINVRLQDETRHALRKLRVQSPGTVALQEMELGVAGAEPLLMAMDGMIRYAHAYRKRFDSPLGDDCGPQREGWLDVVKGIRQMCNGDGVVAMERDGYTRDSKDNGTLESLFWAALEAAGIKEEDAF